MTNSKELCAFYTLFGEIVEYMGDIYWNTKYLKHKWKTENY